ncbi:T-complex protein 1 subunit gamma-like isoform X2 [Hibiscus syriacus]|uniref:T-complex protein 1 subunit gamma-like isoform X2 n=1 Tax=Hibiscus syriacus TaxID=106335 RepID=UPI0019240004|nr:T-complex protein 1 subunit gamma-like isoform X2 [Hibiscus syriacus]
MSQKPLLKKIIILRLCRAYNKALEDAIAVLDKIAMTIDVKHRSMVLGLVKSCIGTKFTSQFGDLIAVSVLFNQNLFLCELLL